jgi:penicillin-binding protein 1B
MNNFQVHFSNALASSKKFLKDKAVTSVQFINDHKTIFMTAVLILFGISAGSLVVAFNFLKERDAFLTEKLSSHQWRMASTIYAEAPVIRTGDPVNAEWLVNYLERLKYRRVANAPVKTSQYRRNENEVVFQKRVLTDSDSADSFPVHVNFQENRIVNISDGHSRRWIASYQLEPFAISNLFGSEYEKRTLVSFHDLPRHLINAVIAIEDRRFFEHRGIDLPGILRAVWHNTFSREGKQGGVPSHNSL